MESMRKLFESNTKTRINIIGPSNSEKSFFAMSLIKDGVFNIQEAKTKKLINSFSTEILCCGPRENKVRILIDFKTKKEILDELKVSILTLMDQSFFEVMHEPVIDSINEDNNKKKNKFINIFIQKVLNNIGISLMKYLGKTDLRQVFLNVNFEMLFDELNNEKYTQKLQIRDDIIWNKYFKQFSRELFEKYDEWNLIIEDYYTDKYGIDGCEYINDYSYDNKIFYNNNLNTLINMLYNNELSCGLMIHRVYIEAPSKENEYSNIVFIDYKNENLQSIFEKNIEERISKDYKEVFLIVLPCNNCFNYIDNIKNKVTKVTLDKRLFCILNKFNEFKRFTQKNEKDVLNNLKENISKELGIQKEKTIINENFNDRDKSLKLLDYNSEFIRLLKLIKAETYSLGKTIKIKNPYRKNLINISLNQERMSVQALMTMLFERYNNHLITEWDKITNSILDDDKNKKYYYNVARSLINNKKYDFYKMNKLDSKHIDFSLRNGEHNEAKKILKMLVNYGYNTVGFDPEKNKILIKVNGDISNEDKVILIELIKGRLEESIIGSFENVFFNNLINKKINMFDLDKSSDNQIDITIDDFYCTFKQVFKTMSKNIQRYEVISQ